MVLQTVLLWEAIRGKTRGKKMNEFNEGTYSFGGFQHYHLQHLVNKDVLSKKPLLDKYNFHCS